MSKHVRWDVRNGADGHHHVTRTEVTRSEKPDGTKSTTVKTDHLKTPQGG